ncbi:MAG TPA: alpha/beta hydrolase [Allosphingosinicella sp.]|nr:alpha/beta hydrolase [Allosphingosinicella sp.]
MPDRPDLRRPSWAQLLMEAPAAARLLAAQLRGPRFGGVRGAGRAVMVIPAFLANDLPTRHLRRTLEHHGFRAFGWEQGLNLGARAGKFARLIERIDAIAAAAPDGKVALVGWSLGGLYARELAKRRPDKVSLVVTMGTPFSGGLRRNNAWKLYEAVNDHDVDHPPVRVEADEKPPVRTVAIWSRRDGIVATASARGREGERDEAIEVGCRHNELVSHKQALRALVRVLAA